jgi:hypothetical protein
VKVGILTFHRANNYGAVLQAYALQETIQQLGHEVEIIDYKQEYIESKYRKVRLNAKSIVSLVRSLVSTVLHYQEFSQRERNFNSFRNNNLTLSKTSYDKSSEIQGFDALISGSDQVWNPKATGYDKTFFLDAIESAINKISYAASIGRDYITEKEKNFILNNIANFDSISVREESAKRIVSSLTDKDIARVLDPTLLADQKIWDKFISKNEYGDYLLVYSVGPLNNLLEIVKETSLKLGIRVLFITEKKIKTSSNQVHLKGVSPEKLLTLIYNAKFIVTNSFHGTAFSLIFNKNFFTIPHKDSGARMIELLSLFNLSKLLVTNKNEISELLTYSINYDEINEILRQEKNKSLKYLESSLSKEI